MKEKDEKTVKHVFNASIISFDIAQKDRYELDLQGKFEVVLREGKYYVERIKPTYPKDYVECCECLKHNPFINNVSSYKRDTIEALQTLITCRDAYWKIAGKEMGLDKPWKPDWSNDDETKFCIYTTQNMISLDIFGVDNRILAFPTEEMRDTFFENFKDLIEQCKELL